MAIAPRSIAADTIGAAADAVAWFATNFTGGTLKPPFNVRTETAGNNVGDFLTGPRGYLPSPIFRFRGTPLSGAGPPPADSPLLPPRSEFPTLSQPRLPRPPPGIPHP